MLVQEQLKWTVRKANEAVLDRLLNALLREPVLDPQWMKSFVSGRELLPAKMIENTLFTDITEWVLLHHPTETLQLLLPVLHEGAFGRYKFAYPVFAQRDETWKEITTSQQLVELMRGDFGIHVDGQVERELDNCRDNFSLAYESLELKRTWVKQQMLTVFRFHGLQETDNFVDFITKLKCAKSFDALLYSEGLAVEGHPLHPLAKTKFGLTTEEVRRYAPEFEQSVPLRAVLVRKDKVRFTSPEGKDEFGLLGNDTNEIAAVMSSMDRIGLGNKEDYRLFLVHPWQYDHVLPELFAEELSRKEIIPIPLTLSSSATLSFRTMILADSGYHLKLPVRVRATSAIRMVSPEITENGPWLSHLLREVVEHEPTLSMGLAIAGEIVGACFVDANDENTIRSSNLSYLFRENPGRYVQSEEIALVAASLTAESPLRERPILIDMMEIYFGTTILEWSQACEYVHHYASRVLPPLLYLLQKYGIALEAHMQNAIVCFSQGAVTKLIVRDLGGVRIHTQRFSERLEHRSCAFPFTDAAIFQDDMSEVYSKFIHSVLQNHLGDLIFHLASYFHKEESELWKSVREAMACSMDSADIHYDNDWRALTQSLVRTKALFGMRLNNTAKSYLYSEFKNPIVE